MKIKTRPQQAKARRMKRCDYNSACNLYQCNFRKVHHIIQFCTTWPNLKSKISPLCLDHYFLIDTTHSQSVRGVKKVNDRMNSIDNHFNFSNDGTCTRKGHLSFAIKVLQRLPRYMHPKKYQIYNPAPKFLHLQYETLRFKKNLKLSQV